MAEGKLKAQETVVEGFEQLPIAINMLFDGENTGKLVVQLWRGRRRASRRPSLTPPLPWRPSLSPAPAAEAFAQPALR